jgi:hypothetical protein
LQADPFEAQRQYVRESTAAAVKKKPGDRNVKADNGALCFDELQLKKKTRRCKKLLFANECQAEDNSLQDVVGVAECRHRRALGSMVHASAQEAPVVRSFGESLFLQEACLNPGTRQLLRSNARNLSVDAEGLVAFLHLSEVCKAVPH